MVIKPFETPEATALRKWTVGGLIGLGGIAAVIPYAIIAVGGAALTLRRAARLGG